MDKIKILTDLGACADAVRFVSANPDIKTWPELARKSQRIDWVLWLLARHSEPGFSLGATNLERRQNITRFACWCALRSLPIFEQRHPTDKRPRQAIEAAQTWAENPTEKNRAAAYAADAADNAFYAADATARTQERSAQVDELLRLAATKGATRC